MNTYESKRQNPDHFGDRYEVLWVETPNKHHEQREIAGQPTEHHVKMSRITAHVVWARGSKAYDLICFDMLTTR